MNKKELSEAIEEGMNNHTNWVGRQILKAMVCVLIVVILFFLWGWLHTLRYPQPQTTGSIPDRCNYPYITCKIYEANRYWACNGKVYPVSVYIELEPKSNITGLSITKSNESCKDVSSHAVLMENRVCGYSEANAWFEQVNKNHEGLYKLKMECN